MIEEKNIKAIIAIDALNRGSGKTAQIANAAKRVRGGFVVAANCVQAKMIKSQYGVDAISINNLYNYMRGKAHCVPFYDHAVISQIAEEKCLKLPENSTPTFGGQVTIDYASKYYGTKFPCGTIEYPVNNMADAKKISQIRGIDKIVIRREGQLVLNDGLNLPKSNSNKATDLTISNIASGSRVYIKSSKRDLIYLNDIVNTANGQIVVETIDGDLIDIHVKHPHMLPFFITTAIFGPTNVAIFQQPY